MSEPRAVDSEGVITFKAVQGDDDNDHSIDVGDDEPDDNHCVPPVVSDHLQRETSMTERSPSTMEANSAAGLLSEVTSVLKSVVEGLNDLKQSSAQYRPTQGPGSNPCIQDVSNRYDPKAQEFVPRSNRINCGNNFEHIEDCDNQQRSWEGTSYRRPPVQRDQSCLPRFQYRSEDFSYPYHSDDYIANVNQSNFDDMHPATCFRGNAQRFRVSNDAVPVKISPFTGNEDWQVWVARFEAIARRKRWTEDDMLDQLLPRIEGQAASFVFSQLHPGTLQSYNNLQPIV